MSSAPGNQHTHHVANPTGHDELPRIDSRPSRFRARPSRAQIDTVPFPGGLAIRIRGELDIASAGSLERALARAAAASAVVLLDLRRTSFMDAVALNVVVRTDRQMRACGGRLILVPGTLAVCRLLRVSGMFSRLEIVEDSTQWPISA